MKMIKPEALLMAIIGVFCFLSTLFAKEYNWVYFGCLVSSFASAYLFQFGDKINRKRKDKR